jgi:hypothetical protein
MNYSHLTLHEKINLRGIYTDFLRIMVVKFRRSQQKAIYQVRTRGRWRLRRTRYLNKNFQTSLVMTGSLDKLQVSFPLYGRFVDMGVGRGTNVTAAQLRKQYRIHKPDVKRVPRRWYSRTKSGEEKKLAEILSKQYGIHLVNLAENLLNQTVVIS